MQSEQLVAQRFARIHGKNLLSFKSEPISVRFSFSIVIDFNLSTINENLLESDRTISLRSNGSQALKPCHYVVVTIATKCFQQYSKEACIAAKMSISKSVVKDN